MVKIAASSVNTVDTMIRKMGKELPLSPETPAILGMDFAGTVEAVGEGTEFRAESKRGDHASALTLEDTLVHGSVIAAV